MILHNAPARRFSARTGGLTNQQIADNIFVSPLTVDSHRNNLPAKFRVKHTAALISFAARHNRL